MNSVLSIVVILELLRTSWPGWKALFPAPAVPGHRHHLGHPDILPVGAELSLTGGSGPPLGRSMTELAVNAQRRLAVALVLVRRFARLDRA